METHESVQKHLEYRERFWQSDEVKQLFEELISEEKNLGMSLLGKSRTDFYNIVDVSN